MYKATRYRVTIRTDAQGYEMAHNILAMAWGAEHGALLHVILLDPRILDA